MTRCIGVCLMILLLVAEIAMAEPPVSFQSMARMPVKEITVFKDGHAFVMHRGVMATDQAGSVVLDHLPAPVIGTFWPFSADEAVKLSAVTAGRRKVVAEQTALTLRELIEANVGVSAIITEVAAGDTQPSYEAVIASVPSRDGEELEALSPPYTGEMLPEKGDVVLLETEAGVKVVAFDRIQDIEFTQEFNLDVVQEQFRNLLTLKLDWGAAGPGRHADVGLLYLQRGIRWIPGYKVEIDGKGTALVRLQATLINELADLEDVTAHLVIGVPTFAFKDTLDPMALQQTMATLSPYFEQDAQTAYGFSNAIMTQQIASAGHLRGNQPAPEPALDLGPEVGEAGKNEDLFIFAVKHLTMKKGERMVLTIGEFTMKYEDVYTLDIPFAPPMELWRTIGGNQQAELARLFNTPTVMHKIRLFNTGEYPLTTAPALILRDDRVLAQGLMRYAAPGVDTDLTVTSAVDIRVKKSDSEISRTPNAARWQDDQYGRIDLAGTITLTSFRDDEVTVEVTRDVLGNVESVGKGGAIEMVNVLEDPSFGASSGVYPSWWGYFQWPWWWHHFNGVGRITWTATLKPHKPVELAYRWNYYWR